MARDSKAARNETIDAIERKSTPEPVLTMIAFANGFAQYILAVRIYICCLTLLPSVYREINGLAKIRTSSSSVENIFSNVHNVTPEASCSELRLLSHNSLTEVKVIVCCNVRPWSRLCGEVGGECSAVFRNLRYPANGEQMF